MKEKGFTQTPNNILEALAKTKLSSYESRYVFALQRKTFGFQKVEDFIANSQFSNLTGIPRPHISRTEHKLIKRKIVVRNGRMVGFNPSTEAWEKLPQKVTITQTGNTVTSVGNEKLPVGVATKESKETIQKKDVLLLKSSIELLEAYKKGDRGRKPFYMGDEMRWVPASRKLYVLPKNGGEWLEFVGKNPDIGKIEWK